MQTQREIKTAAHIFLFTELYQDCPSVLHLFFPFQMRVKLDLPFADDTLILFEGDLFWVYSDNFKSTSC